MGADGAGRTGDVVRGGGLELDPEEGQQDLPDPHGSGQPARGDGEDDRDEAFDADAGIATKRARAVVTVRVTATESGDHGDLRAGGVGHGPA
jgi:hypothetical protein